MQGIPDYCKAVNTRSPVISIDSVRFIIRAKWPDHTGALCSMLVRGHRTSAADAESEAPPNPSSIYVPLFFVIVVRSPSRCDCDNARPYCRFSLSACPHAVARINIMFYGNRFLSTQRTCMNAAANARLADLESTTCSCIETQQWQQFGRSLWKLLLHDVILQARGIRCAGTIHPFSEF